MALSEHEQRMLDAIEQALFEDDPKFASSVNPARIRRRRPVLSVSLFLVGLIALIVGAIVATLSIFALGVTVTVLGFMLMVGGVGLFVYGLPGSGAPVKGGGPSTVPSTLSTRMEERLRRRFEEQ